MGAEVRGSAVAALVSARLVDGLGALAGSVGGRWRGGVSGGWCRRVDRANQPRCWRIGVGLPGRFTRIGLSSPILAREGVRFDLGECRRGAGTGPLLWAWRPKAASDAALAGTAPFRAAWPLAWQLVGIQSERHIRRSAQGIVTRRAETPFLPHFNRFETRTPSCGKKGGSGRVSGSEPD